jgi:hypothetical protein
MEKIIRNLTMADLVQIVGHRNWKGASLGDTLVVVMYPGAYVEGDAAKIQKALADRVGCSVKADREDVTVGGSEITKLEFRLEGGDGGAP